jgi:hypothetical protein
MTASFRPAFGDPADRLEGARAEFERIALELEGIAAWLRGRDADSEQARRLQETAQQMRADSHLPPR